MLATLLLFLLTLTTAYASPLSLTARGKGGIESSLNPFSAAGYQSLSPARLPRLPYAYDALEPVISKEIMVSCLLLLFPSSERC
jgi:hypothetical protein